MSDRSANLSLPFILPSQAQKHVTHNEALLALDALVQLSVVSADVTDPPADPDDGARYIVPEAATGAWSGQTGAVALFDATGWLFFAPQEGWIAWVTDQDRQLCFTGGQWVPLAGVPESVNLLGVNATADPTNRLTVGSDATLLTHDGAGHQLKLNKAAAGDTVSLLMQTDWSGRAEIGLVGSDELVFKVSDDGTTFRTALSAAGDTGRAHFPNGASGLAPSGTGAEVLTTLDYVAALGGAGVANGAGHLPSAFNFPAGSVRDTVVTPDLPASFSFAGYSPGAVRMAELIPVDPSACYRMRCYFRQEGVSGDWSAFAEEERHQQGAGLICFDAARQEIEPRHHLRYRSGGVDSLTTLAAPLAPGDTSVSLTDASGWNDSDSAAEACGLIIFGYEDPNGRPYSQYSRLVEHDLFAPAGVNKSTHVVTLSGPLPASLGNPGDGGGVWPAGTPVANTAAGSGPKLCLLPDAVPAATGAWYRAEGFIGGLDASGTNAAANFAPGTAYVAPAFRPNWSNRPGGWNGFPDTGSGQRVWFGGVHLSEDPLAVRIAVSSGGTSGSWALHVPLPNTSTGQVDMVAATPGLSEL